MARRSSRVGGAAGVIKPSTPERRAVAAAVGRLRTFIGNGGRPYLTPEGKVGISSRVPDCCSRATRAEQDTIIREDGRFYSAVCHEVGHRHILRAIRFVGTRNAIGGFYEPRTPAR